MEDSSGNRRTSHALPDKKKEETSHNVVEANELREMDARLRTLIAAIPDLVYFKDTEGRHLFVNKAMEEFTGLKREEIIGKTDADLLPPELLKACRKSDWEVIENRRTLHFEESYTRRDGSTVCLDTVKVPVVDSSDNVVGLVAISRDITCRKRAEEDLWTSREFVKSILDTVDEGFIVIDRDYKIISANNAYCRQVNMPLEDVIGRHCYEVSHGSERPCYQGGENCAVRRSLEDGEPCVSVHKHRDKDGTPLYVETKSYPLRDASGRITSSIEIINNITDKHLLEERVLRTQKLEAIGLLAGGIAHDFNNLLQGVFGNISLAKTLCDKEGRIYELLDRAEKALDLSKRLTQQLLTFSKGGEPARKTVFLTSVIKGAVKFALSGSNVSYKFLMDDDLLPVEADEGQLNQAINNIVLNAGDAMHGGGTVTIRANNVLVDERSGLPLKSGRYVMIAIEDSGPGIAEEHLSRIFDPYFTTKEHGNGLGLATSYSIIKRHDGIIDVKSQIGVGSQFFIYLPASGKAPISKKRERKVLLTGKGRILVMDDEEMVRMVTGQMLENLGYEVEFAEKGEEAVDKYARSLTSGRPFDAVILDLTIRGGMGGGEAIREMIAANPNVRAIVSSGYSDDPIVANYQDYGFKGTLAKPYNLQALSGTLHEVLGEEKRQDHG
jgi:two-component system cell cycle sensor histidine kinase/response regulator CckA